MNPASRFVVSYSIDPPSSSKQHTLMSYNLQEASSNFALDVPISSSNPSASPEALHRPFLEVNDGHQVDPLTPYDASQHSFLTQLMYDKYTPAEADNFSSFWSPAHNVVEPYLSLDKTNGQPLSSAHAPLGSTGDPGVEPQGAVNGIYRPQYVTKLDPYDLIRIGINTTNSSSTSDLSFYSDSPTWDAADKTARQSCTRQASSRNISLHNSIARSARSSSSSPSPSRNLSPGTSSSSQVESYYEGILLNDDSAENAKQAPTKARKASARCKASVSIHARTHKFSRTIPATVDDVGASSSKNRKRKCAGSASYSRCLYFPTETAGQRRRRNVQVSDSGATSPILLRDGSYTCPISGCAIEMHREQDMRRHIDSHLGKGYKCPLCGKVFSRSDATRRHLRGANECGREAEMRMLVPIPLEA